MKLRLPHRLQAALVAALASVSFTTLSSGSLSAAFFFGSQAFAEEAADNPGATIDIGDTNLDPQAAIDEEEGKGEAKEPGSAPINQAGFNGIRGSSDDFDRQSTTEAATESSIATENVGTAGQANFTDTSADLPSNDLGFTSNSYASGSSNGSVVDSPVTSFTQATAVPAVQQVQYVESTTPTTSSGTTTTGAATGGYSATPVSGATGGGGYNLSSPAMPRAAVVTVPATTDATAPAAEAAMTDSGSADSTPADELGSTTPSISVGGASLVRALYSAPAPAMLGAAGAANNQTLHVYILTGQSNSEGAVKTAPASQEMLDKYSSDTLFWHTVLQNYSAAQPTVITSTAWATVAPHEPYEGGNLCMGPEYGFSYMFNKLAADSTVTNGSGQRMDIGQLAVVKASLNGGGNTYWVRGGVTYNLMLDSIKTAITQAAADGYTSISIDGLLYLQGESNDASPDVANRYNTLLSDFTNDLNTWKADQSAAIQGMTVAFQNNSVLGEPSRNRYNTIESQIAMATKDGHVNTDDNGKGFIYANSDLGTGPDGLHYSGEAQITIGARYAYAFAVQEGYNVGAVRGSNKNASLDSDMAWWMEAKPSTTDVVKWDVSSVANTNTISNTLTVGGILVEDPYKGQVNITGGTLHVGTQGIELKEGSLSVSSIVATDAAQTWKVAGGRSLNLGNASNAIAHDISLVGTGTGTATVVAAGTTQGWNVSGDVSLKFASATAVTVAQAANLKLASLNGEDLSLTSLTLESGSSLAVGGAGVAGGLNVGILALGGDATINMDFLKTSRYDTLSIGSSVSGSGTVTFNFNVGYTGLGGDFNVVTGWGDGTNFTATGLDAFEGARLSNVNGNLVLTLPGSGERSDFTKKWPEGTPETATITTSNVYDASALGKKDNVLVNSRTSTGDLYYFTVGNSSGTRAIGTEEAPVDLYSELSGVSATWVSAAGSNKSSTKITDLWGNASVKVTGNQTFETTAYSAVNASTVHGNVYMELDDANATYNSINGTHQTNITGDNTIVINGGHVTGKVVAGSVNGGTTIGGSTYLQIDDGTFDSEVTGGNNTGNTGSAVIQGDVNVMINGGTFKNWVLIGGMYNGQVNGDVYLTITGGDFSALATGNKGIYAGVGSTNASVRGGDSYITLEGISEGNTFASYTGVLSGGNQAGSAQAITNRNLELAGVTTAISANLQDFTNLTVTEGSEATLSRSCQNTLGGASTILIKDDSFLTLNGDQSDPWDLTDKTFTVEAGSALNKRGQYWTNIGTLAGQGTYDLQGGGGSQVNSLSDFSGTVHVGNNTTLEMMNAGSANVTFSVDAGGTAKVASGNGTVGTLAGTGTVEMKNAIKTGSDATAFNFDPNWTGTVKVTASDGGTLYLSKLGQTGSTIEIAGVTGVNLAHSAGNKVTANIKLSGDLTLTDGFSKNTTFFEGNWSGSGAFNANMDPTQTFNFRGNMNEYTGTVTLKNAQTLQFGATDGSDVSLNMGIPDTSDTGKGIIHGAGSGSAKTAKVETYYLSDAVSRSTMTGNLSLTQKGSQTLTLYGQNTYTGATTVEKGSLKLDGAGTTGTGDVVLKHDTSLAIHKIMLGDNAVIETNGADAVISNHSVVNANSIQGASSSSIATVSHANIAVAEGKSLELANVKLVDTAITGQVDLTTGVNADNLTIYAASTFKLAGEDMLRVEGALALQAGATLDLARLFASQEEPVQNAPLRASGVPALFSAVGGDSSGMSIDGNLDGGNLALLGAAEPAEGSTYVLATAQSIDLANGVNLTNLADGYSGSLSKVAADGGGYNLILTLNEIHDLIWDGNADGKWGSGNNWHAAGDEPGTAAFRNDDNVTFTSTYSTTATLANDVTASTMVVESGAKATIDTATHNLTVAVLESNGGSISKSGAGTAEFGGKDGVTLASLKVEGGTAVFDQHVTITGNAAISVTNSGTELQLLDGMSFNGTGGQFAYALNVGSSGAKAVLGGTTVMSARNIGGALGATIELAENANVTVLGVLNTRTNDNNQNVDMGDGSILTAGEFRSQTLTLGNNAVLNLTGSNDNDSKIVNVTGSGNINVQARTLTLSGSSNYTGNVTLSNAANLEINATNFGGKIANTGTGTITMYGTAGQVANADARISVTKKKGQQLVLAAGSEKAISKVTVAAGDGQWLLAEGIGENTDGLYTDIHLGGKGLILSQPNTTVNIGSLSGVSGTTVQGDYNTGGGRVLAVHQDEDAEYAGIFTSGSNNRSVGLNKYGSSTLTLTGANASTNALNIYEGAIKLDGADAKWSGAATVYGGGTLELTSSVAALASNVTINSGGTLTLGNYKDDAVTATSLTLRSGSILDLSALNLTGTETQPITLVKGGEIDDAHLSSVHVVFAEGVTPSEGYTLSKDANNNLVLTFAQSIDALIWDNNTTNQKWSTSQEDRNWHNAGKEHGSAYFTTNANVAFVNGTSTAQLQEAITAGTMTLEDGANLTVNTNGNSLTVTDLDTLGTPSLTKDGTGKATFGGSDEEGVTLSGLNVKVGSAEFAEKVTVDGIKRVYVADKGTTASAEFKGGLEYNGSDTYALAVYEGEGNQATLYGESDLGGKQIGIGKNAKLIIAENASVTSGGVKNSGNFESNGAVVLQDNATLTQQSGQFVTTDLTLGKGAVVNLNADNRDATVATIGSISGEGEIHISSQVRNRTYNIQGNIEDWTGAITQDSSAGSMTLNISGTDVVNADITNSAKTNPASILTLNLKDDMTVNGKVTYTAVAPIDMNVGNSGTAADVTFTNEVKVRNLNVANAGSSATFEGPTQINGTISGNGEMTVNSGSNTVTVEGANNLKGDTTVTAGTLLLNGGGSMGKVIVNGGEFNTTGAQAITLNSLSVSNGIAHVGNSGKVNLGTVSLTGGDLVLNTTVSAGSLTTTSGATLTFAGENMLTTTGDIDLRGGLQLDLSKITYRTDTSEKQTITLATITESGDITLGGTYTFINSKTPEGTASFTLKDDGNKHLVLEVEYLDVTDWPDNTKVSYTYTVGTGEEPLKETHYDIATDEGRRTAHGYNFSQTDDGVVEFNPNQFNNATHTYTDSHDIVMHSNTTIVVEEGNTVKLTGELSSENYSGGGISGTLIKDGAGTLEMAINDKETGPDDYRRNTFEGSVEVSEGTLHVLYGKNGSELAAGDGAHVCVSKGATLDLEAGVSIGIPMGHRTKPEAGDSRAVVISAYEGGATVQNAYISQDGIRPEDARDGGRARVENAYELRIGNLQDMTQAVTIELSDIIASSVFLEGNVTIDNSHIQSSGDMRIYNDVNAPNTIRNNSIVELTGFWGLINNTDVDKTSKINFLPETEEYYGATLVGQNKVEVGSAENGGVATRTVSDTEITYLSDQYKGLVLGSDDYKSDLSLGITLSDVDLPDDLSGYKFTLTFEDFNTSYVFGETSEFIPLEDSALNVSLFIPEYTGGQWEELVASVQAKYDTATGNTVFMFEHIMTPEPTTGTLSLLALAALAARRRRK